jgi:hypothetical protein
MPLQTRPILASPALLSAEPAPRALMERFITAYSNFNLGVVAELEPLYAPDVVFKDPVQSLQGWPALKRYFLASCENLSACQFEFHDLLLGQGSAAFHWTMHYQHKRIAKGAPQSLGGVTWIRFSQRIEFHEDFYDMGALLYDKLPLLGAATRAIKTRMAHH